MVIDIHTHNFPAELIDEAREGNAFDGLTIQPIHEKEYIRHRQGSRYPLVKEFFDLNAKIQQMDKLGIDLSILSLSPTLFMYWVDENEADKFCKRMNDLLAKFISESNGRLLGLATVPLQNTDLAVNELRRAISDLKFCGVQIGTSVESVPLDDSSLYPFFEEVQVLDVPVLIHPYAVGKRDRMGDFHLNNLIGNPLDTELAAARMIFSGFLDRFPNLKIILAHGGGFLPYQIGRFDHAYNRSSIDSSTRSPASLLSREIFL